MTVAPRCFAHWHIIRPTPPAAAWIRIVSPRCTLYLSRSRQRAVMPRIIIEAAVRSSMPVGRVMRQFSVGAFRHPGIDDAIANRKAVHAGSESVDDSRAFKPDRRG